MGMPAVTVEVAFTTDPNDAVPVWDDVTEFLLDFSVTRGRPDELSAYGPGQATITLANEQRTFDNYYDAGPYYPNVVPMRRVRIRAVYNAVTYDVFDGYADGWEQTYNPPEVATCVLTATDAFKVLANTTLLTSAYAEEVDSDAPYAWWRLGDEAEPAVDRQSGGLLLVQTGSQEPEFGQASLVPNEPDAAVAFPAGVSGLQGIFPESTFPLATEGTVEFWYRYDGTYVSSNIVTIRALQTTAITAGRGITILFDTGGSFGRVYVVTRSDLDAPEAWTTGVNLADELPHHIAVRWKAGEQIKVYVDGVDRTAVASGTFTGTMAITGYKWIVAVNYSDWGPYGFEGQTATLDDLAVYTSALDAARIEAHYDAAQNAWAGDTSGERIERLIDVAGWTGPVDIDDGTAVLQAQDIGGDVLSAMQAVEETEQGRLFVTGGGVLRFIGRQTLQSATRHMAANGVFGDEDPELEYADLVYADDDQSIINEVQVSRAGGVLVVVRDDASQDRYLRRTRTLSGLLHQSDETSRDLGLWILDHYSEPRRRATSLKLEPSAGNDATHFPLILGLELADNVQVRRRPQGIGAEIYQYVLIEGIRHDVTATEWLTEWSLAPAETEAGYWILGTSELGVSTKLGF